MKELFVLSHFRGRSLTMIEDANVIIEKFIEEGFVLTLRQLYYQFVAKDWIENSERSYKNLGRLISKARLAGLIDWDAIEDRTRNKVIASHWTSPGAILKTAAEQFQIDKWLNQELRVQIWIEKEALSGVFEGLCLRYDVPLYACRGYNSQSEMYLSAKDIEANKNNGQKTVILYFGDHDPSGLDMDRDIQNRFEVFGVHNNIEFKRVALSQDQTEQYNLPPNPTKVSDARAPAYVEKYGSKSWELDALDPTVLNELADDAIAEYYNANIFEISLEKESNYRRVLKEFADNWEDHI